MRVPITSACVTSTENEHEAFVAAGWPARMCQDAFRDAGFSLARSRAIRRDLMRVPITSSCVASTENEHEAFVAAGWPARTCQDAFRDAGFSLARSRAIRRHL